MSTRPFHFQRHSFVTYLAKATRPTNCGELTSHTSSAIHAHYPKVQFNPLKSVIA